MHFFGSFKDAKPVSTKKISGGARILAFGGGKGGIGKSFITSNIAICLAQMGKKVVLIDLDFGGANAHTCIGGEMPSKTLYDFIRGSVKQLSDTLAPSPVKNLQLISGNDDQLRNAELTGRQIHELKEAVLGLDADFVILDLGAGTAKATLDFFLLADNSFVVTSPEPTSIENAYRFIKSAFYRRLTEIEKDLGLGGVADSVMDSLGGNAIRTPADLLAAVSEKDPERGVILRQLMAQFAINVIVNMVRTDSDRAIGPSMSAICRRYFGITSEFSGFLEFDNAAWQALRRRRPIVLEYPSTTLSRNLYSLARSLIDNKPRQAVV